MLFRSSPPPSPPPDPPSSLSLPVSSSPFPKLSLGFLGGGSFGGLVDREKAPGGKGLRCGLIDPNAALALSEGVGFAFAGRPNFPWIFKNKMDEVSYCNQK